MSEFQPDDGRRTTRVHGRLYVLVDDQPQTGDVVSWVDHSSVRTNKVIRVGGLKGKEPWVVLEAHAHQGHRHFRVSISRVQRCWRWHKKVEGACDSESSTA
jgi:hypothetical protein